MAGISDIVKALEELQEDTTVPRNVKLKIQGIMAILKDKTETAMKTDKALQMLDEIADDTNLQPYTRTQLWNVVSMLEKG